MNDKTLKMPTERKRMKQTSTRPRAKTNGASAESIFTANMQSLQNLIANGANQEIYKIAAGNEATNIGNGLKSTNSAIQASFDQLPPIFKIGGVSMTREYAIELLKWAQQNNCSIPNGQDSSQLLNCSGPLQESPAIVHHKPSLADFNFQALPVVMSQPNQFQPNATDYIQAAKGWKSTLNFTPDAIRDMTAVKHRILANSMPNSTSGVTSIGEQWVSTDVPERHAVSRQTFETSVPPPPYPTHLSQKDVFIPAESVAIPLNSFANQITSTTMAPSTSTNGRRTDIDFHALDTWAHTHANPRRASKESAGSHVTEQSLDDDTMPKIIACYSLNSQAYEPQTTNEARYDEIITKVIDDAKKLAELGNGKFTPVVTVVPTGLAEEKAQNSRRRRGGANTRRAKTRRRKTGRSHNSLLEEANLQADLGKISLENFSNAPAQNMHVIGTYPSTITICNNANSTNNTQTDTQAKQNPQDGVTETQLAGPNTGLGTSNNTLEMNDIQSSPASERVDGQPTSQAQSSSTNLANAAQIDNTAQAEPLDYSMKTLRNLEEQKRSFETALDLSLPRNLPEISSEPAPKENFTSLNVVQPLNESATSAASNLEILSNVAVSIQSESGSGSAERNKVVGPSAAVSLETSVSQSSTASTLVSQSNLSIETQTASAQIAGVTSVSSVLSSESQKLEDSTTKDEVPYLEVVGRHMDAIIEHEIVENAPETVNPKNWEVSSTTLAKPPNKSSEVTTVGTKIGGTSTEPARETRKPKETSTNTDKGSIGAETDHASECVNFESPIPSKSVIIEISGCTDTTLPISDGQNCGGIGAEITTEPVEITQDTCGDLSTNLHENERVGSKDSDIINHDTLMGIALGEKIQHSGNVIKSAKSRSVGMNSAGKVKPFTVIRTEPSLDGQKDINIYGKRVDSGNDAVVESAEAPSADTRNNGEVKPPLDKGTELTLDLLDDHKDLNIYGKRMSDSGHATLIKSDSNENTFSDAGKESTLDWLDGHSTVIKSAKGQSIDECNAADMRSLFLAAEEDSIIDGLDEQAAMDRSGSSEEGGILEKLAKELGQCDIYTKEYDENKLESQLSPVLKLKSEKKFKVVNMNQACRESAKSHTDHNSNQVELKAEFKETKLHEVASQQSVARNSELVDNGIVRPAVRSIAHISTVTGNFQHDKIGSNASPYALSSGEVKSDVDVSSNNSTADISLAKIKYEQTCAKKEVGHDDSLLKSTSLVHNDEKTATDQHKVSVIKPLIGTQDEGQYSEAKDTKEKQIAGDHKAIAKYGDIADSKTAKISSKTISLAKGEKFDSISGGNFKPASVVIRRPLLSVELTIRKSVKIKDKHAVKPDCEDAKNSVAEAEKDHDNSHNDKDVAVKDSVKQKRKKNVVSTDEDSLTLAELSKKLPKLKCDDNVVQPHTGGAFTPRSTKRIPKIRCGLEKTLSRKSYVEIDEKQQMVSVWDEITSPSKIPNSASKMPNTTPKMRSTTSKRAKSALKKARSSLKIARSTSKTPNSALKIARSTLKIASPTLKATNSALKIASPIPRLPNTIPKLSSSSLKIPNTTTKLPSSVPWLPSATLKLPSTLKTPTSEGSPSGPKVPVVPCKLPAPLVISEPHNDPEPCTSPVLQKKRLSFESDHKSPTKGRFALKHGYNVNATWTPGDIKIKRRKLIKKEEKCKKLEPAKVSPKQSALTYILLSDSSDSSEESDVISTVKMKKKRTRRALNKSLTTAGNSRIKIKKETNLTFESMLDKGAQPIKTEKLGRKDHRAPNEIVSNKLGSKMDGSTNEEIVKSTFHSDFGPEFSDSANDQPKEAFVAGTELPDMELASGESQKSDVVGERSQTTGPSRYSLPNNIFRRPASGKILSRIAGIMLESTKTYPGHDDTSRPTPKRQSINLKSFVKDPPGVRPARRKVKRKWTRRKKTTSNLYSVPQSSIATDESVYGPGSDVAKMIYSVPSNSTTNETAKSVNVISGYHGPECSISDAGDPELLFRKNFEILYPGQPDSNEMEESSNGPESSSTDAHGPKLKRRKNSRFLYSGRNQDQSAHGLESYKVSSFTLKRRINSRLLYSGYQDSTYNPENSVDGSENSITESVTIPKPKRRKNFMLKSRQLGKAPSTTVRRGRGRPVKSKNRRIVFTKRKSALLKTPKAQPPRPVLPQRSPADENVRARITRHCEDHGWPEVNSLRPPIIFKQQADIPQAPVIQEFSTVVHGLTQMGIVTNEQPELPEYSRATPVQIYEEISGQSTTAKQKLKPCSILIQKLDA